MSNVNVVEILKECDALLEGHFLLSSGKHSNRYVQCAKVLRFPNQAKKVLSTVVDQIKDLGIDLVVGPAMGGVIVSYELGRQLNKESVFTERKDGVMQLRRGFEVKPGAKIIIAEDVVTTGKSKKNYTFCIPVNASLDLKKAAKLAGEKSLELLHVKNLFDLTGYVRGGCTPIGMKKSFKTFIHESFLTYETVCLSGGERGIQIELNPNDLTKLIQVTYADIIVKE